MRPRCAPPAPTSSCQESPSCRPRSSGTRRTEGGHMFWTKPELLPVGTPAPDFTVQDHLGRTVRRADLLGQRTILYWFPKADTPGCTKEACGFRDHFAELIG